MSESRTVWDIWVQPAWIQLTPARTHHGNRAEHQSALRNPGTFKGQKHWTGLDWTSGRLHQQEGRKPGRRERARTCAGSEVKRCQVTRASQQQVEISQQGVDVGERSSPEGEGRELGQKVLQREPERGQMEADAAGAGLIPHRRRDHLSALMSQQHCLTWLTSEEASSLPPALRAGWASSSPRSSSSDRSSSGIGCLQNRKESYWLLDLSIISESEEKPGMMVETRSQDYHQLICLKLDQHSQWNQIKPLINSILAQDGLNSHRCWRARIQTNQTGQRSWAGAVWSR